jgi:diacylglycerol kinase family enzyme
VQLTVPEGTDLFFQLDGELREPMGAKTLDLEIRRGALPVFAGGEGEA